MHIIPARNETILWLSGAVAAGKIGSQELVERCLSQIDRWEDRVRAWVSIDRDGARRQAEQLDAQFRAGRVRGRLHGIPIGIKDIIDLAGQPTACGSALLARHVAAADATLVTRLRDAGAVILGKTVTTTFASFDPPITRNPWNLDRTPGGSSSGSAAAVATGMCVAAIGSQTGGSITRPASFCGVAGCKPSYGRVSVRGVAALAPSMDHPGPIARCVADLAILLDAIVGPDDGDPTALRETAPRTLEAVLETPTSEPSIGLLRGMFESQVHPAMRGAMEQVQNTLRSAGANIAEVSLPTDFESVIANHRVIMAAEAAATHRKLFEQERAQYPPKIRGLIDEGNAIGATDYISARQHQARLAAAMQVCFESTDALLTPATIGPAPDTSTTGDPAFNSPWSYTGFPTISIPVMLDSNGLPLAIQLIGHPAGEARLFQVAAWCERVLSGDGIVDSRISG